MLNIDLHCHSNVSDGVLSPADVVARAAANGVDVLALTDHDDVSGLAAAQTAAAGTDMTLIPGVEISVTWGGQTVHIVGLRIDDPLAMETEVNQWPGVVTVGIFARHRARVCLLGTAQGVRTMRFD